MSVKPRGLSTPSTAAVTDKEATSSRGGWEAPTPVRPAPSTEVSTQITQMSSTPRTALTNRAMRMAGFIIDEPVGDEKETPSQAHEESDDEDFDRRFYLSEEGQTTVENEEDVTSKFLGNPLKFKEREEQMAKSRARGDAKIAGMSAKMSQLHADQEAWEDNRLLQSGVAMLREVQTEFDNEEDARVQLIVHTLKPPFLDGRVTFSMIQTSVSVVRDPTSDMAVNARDGSALLKIVREKREQMKMRTRFWELGGSKMGDAMGIARPQEQEDGPKAITVGEASQEGLENPEDIEDDDRVDYKDGSSFAKHMKGQKNEAQSQFAKTKSIKEQREYLPVYAVRDQLLDVIRENQVVIVVGETGSGSSAASLLCLFLTFVL